MEQNNIIQQQEGSNPLITKDDSIESVMAISANSIEQSQGQLKSLSTILNLIGTSQDLNEKIERIRSFKGDKERQKALKNATLPWFSLGEYRNQHRSNSDLISIRYLIHDLDDVKTDLDRLREQLRSIPYVLAFFISPSGNGLKVICELEQSIADVEEFRQVYKYYAEDFLSKYGVALDPNGEKATQPCYYSYDPEIYVNPNRLKLPVIKQKGKPKQIPVIEAALQGTEPGSRTYNVSRQVGLYLKKGFSKELTISHVLEWNKKNIPPLEEARVISTVEDMYKRYDKLPVKYSEKDGSYFKNIKEGKDLKQIQMTTFTIQPKELLVLPNSDCLRCSISTNAGYVYDNILIENSDWYSKAKLLKALGHQDCSLLGSENDVQGLCSYVNAGVEVRKTGTKVIGCIDNLWVTADSNISLSGIMETPKIIPYDKGADAFYRKIVYPIVSDAEYQVMLSGFYEDILKINTSEVIIPWLGWLFATPLKPKIQEILGGFPVVFVHGSQGSGKTSTAQQFMRMLGYKDHQPYSVTMKPFPMLKILSSTNAIPIFLDEYKVRDMTIEQKDNIHRYMRKCYNSEVESKGRQDQTVEDYILAAPIVVMGEWDINEPAIKERLLVIRYTNAMKKNTAMQEAFDRLKTLHLEAFMPRYIQFVLGLDLGLIWEKASDDVKKAFSDPDTIAPRILNNLIVMTAGLQMFGDFIKSQNIPTLQYDLKNILTNQLKEITGSNSGQVRSAVDQLIEELGIMWQKNEKQIMPAPMGKDPLVIQVPWWKEATVDSIKVIAIKFNKIFPEFKEYAQRTKYEGELLDKNSYRKLFDDTDYIHSKDQPVDFDGKKHRCLCININKAIAAGIDLEGFGIENVTPVT